MRVLGPKLVNSELEVLITVPDSETLLLEFERQGFRVVVVGSLKDLEAKHYDVLVVNTLELALCIPFMTTDTIVIALGKNDIGPYDALINLDVRGGYSIIGLRPATVGSLGYAGA